MEQIFEISKNISPVAFYGVNNCNLQLLKNLCPNLKMSMRGTCLRVNGEEEDLRYFGMMFQKMMQNCVLESQLTESIIIEIVKGAAPQETKVDNLIVYGMQGKSIVARTASQQKLVEAFEKSDLLFAVGPAGSGKTYTAIALAVKALKAKQIRRIILSRPAVEAGEKLGYLPGDMKEKIDPYLQPLYDALQDMIQGTKLKELLGNGTIQIAPLAFMRGRTLSDAVCILDEAQNTTAEQIKMFLTRMGLNSKIIVTGDVSQIDLPHGQKSGLLDAMQKLKDVEGVSRIEFNKKDIVRHRLVARIVDAYEKNHNKIYK